MSSETVSEGHASEDYMPVEKMVNLELSINQRTEPVNLMGFRSGALTACYPTSEHSDRGTLWMCRCNCSNFVRVAYKDFIGSTVTSCGCDSCSARKNAKGALQDLSGSWRGMLKVLRPVDPSNFDRYICRCNCGRIVEKTAYELINSKAQRSCGCLEASLAVDGPDLSSCAHHPLRYLWNTIRSRARNNEGDRAFEMSPEWVDYRDFYDWAYSNGWAPNASLCRRDCSEPFSPENCFWGTRIESVKGRRPRRRLMDAEPFITQGGDEHV